MRTQLTHVIAALAVMCVPTSARGQDQASIRQLSIDEAVSLALEHNVGVRVERINPKIQDLSVAMARAAWKPSVMAGANHLAGYEAGAAIGLGQELPWGGGYTMAFDRSRIESNTLFGTANSSQSSNLTGSFVLPLGRDFLINGNRQQLRVSKANQQIADFEFTQTTLQTVRDVKAAYWNLAYARASLGVQQQSVNLASASLGESRFRLNAGMMAPLDVVEAEAEVARREEAVIVAEAAVARAEDRLRTLIFDPHMSGFWNVTLELTDAPNVAPVIPDADAAVRKALTERTDLLIARKGTDIADLNIRYAENQARPDVRLEVGRGLPSAQFGYGSAFANPLTNVGWRASLSVSRPIGSSAAETSLARTRLQRERATAQITSLELQIAAEVREAARQVSTDAKRIDATKAARQLAERRLESEEKKFAAGFSTGFLVFQAQRDLAQARLTELRATLDFNTALVDFDVIQVAPIAAERRSDAARSTRGQ